MKTNNFSFNFGRKYLTGLFRYVIENLLGISANSIPKGKALIRLESQALYFLPLNENLEQGYLNTLLKIFERVC